VPAGLARVMPPRAPRSNPPSRAPGPGRRSVQLREQIESLQGEFDEAGWHVVQRRPFAAFALGPVRAIPSGELTAGRIGWVREVRRALPAEAKARDAPERVAGLYLVVHPDEGRGTTRSDGAAPGAGAGAVAFAAECRTIPRSRLLLRSEDKRATPTLKRLAAELKAELEDETRD
jgi:hypothetical protein